MEYLGLFTLLVLYFIVDCFLIDKKICWLATSVWTIPIFGMVINSKNIYEINGLIVLLCFVLIFIYIKSIFGVIIWNTKERVIKYGIFLLIYAIVFPVTYYVFNESMNLGYIPYISYILIIKSISLRNLTNFVLWAFISFFVSFPIYNFFDNTFGKYNNLILIQCKCYSTNLLFGIFSKYYIEGVSNGKWYRFEMSKRIYLIICKEKILEFNIKKGIFGGYYIFSNPCPKLEKKALKRDRKVARLSLIFFIFTLLLGIYIFILSYR